MVDVEAVKRWMREHLDEIGSMEDAAERFGMRPETFRKQFVRQAGVSFSVWLLEARVRRAKELLLTTNDRCFEIVYRIGLRREDAFATTFKRATGMTMEQFRQAHRLLSNVRALTEERVGVDKRVNVAYR